VHLATSSATEAQVAEATIRLFVDSEAKGTNDGTSWADAFVDLQDALESPEIPNCCVAGGCEIWVAAGTYRPDRLTGDRLASFCLASCVRLYGGFVGVESELTERNWILNETTLTGDLAGNDIPNLEQGIQCYTVSSVEYPDSCDAHDLNHDGKVDESDLGTEENSYQVVKTSGVNSATTINGFTITAGFGGSDGAGLYNGDGKPQIANCTFRANLVVGRGGAVYNDDGDPVITDSTFTANRSKSNHGGAFATGGGGHVMIVRSDFTNNWSNVAGAVYSSGGAIDIHNTTFQGNHCTWGWGGALGIVNSNSVTVVNCLFSGNSGNGGGAIYSFNSDLHVYNSTLVSNWSDRSNLGGAIYHNNGNLILANSVLWGNLAKNGSIENAQVAAYSEAAVIQNCCIQGCNEYCSGGSNGNFGDHPLLLDVYGADGLPGTPDDNPYPHPLSPLIDAGDNTAVPADFADLDGDGDTDERMPLDLAGHARFVDACATEDTGVADLPDYPDVVDIGAYEYQPTDVDQDGAIGLLDHSELTSCLTGVSGDLPGAGCEAIDLDCDGDVDLSDFSAFQRAFPGS